MIKNLLFNILNKTMQKIKSKIETTVPKLVEETLPSHPQIFVKTLKKSSVKNYLLTKNLCHLHLLRKNLLIP